MKITVVGLRTINFTANDGNTIKGRTAYIAYETQGVDGMMTEKIFLSDDRFGDVDLTVGFDYDITYNRFGKVEAIRQAKA